jgi:protein-disulfide isomerase
MRFRRELPRLFPFPEQEFFVKSVPVLAALLACVAGAQPALAKKVPVPLERQSNDEVRLFFTEDPDAPRYAPPGYDFTIVEYMDYQCPYCRSANATLKKLIAKDKKVRVIFRDIPVFGPASEKAARIAIAAKYQNKYMAVHDALLQANRPLNDAKIEAAVKNAGADWNRLQADLKRYATDIDDLIERNLLQSEMLHYTGTPGWIFGDTLGYGDVKLIAIEEEIAKQRAKKKK